ncbi:induced myeloid leukemia cell differentiation protein Mcl-1 [Hemicordylus capensis]|uniref:induced myeloid leukemia cell differentiation protein Mcl-1 n=1 Tax=Hemicordylus capensis TaxID=884348 RepID=UPI002303A259|nr:induced myeloid leukemia cell differentiation protein Mcl-1 [Hemicordylus capensis]
MLNRKAMVLYCGSAPGMAPSSPASPCGGGGVGRADAPLANGLSEALRPYPAAAAAARRGPCPSEAAAARALIGGGGPPRAGPLLGGLPLLGPFEGAPPRALGMMMGSGAAGEASRRPPEEELDGCEPDAEEPQAGAAPSSASPQPAPPGPRVGDDELRKETLALVCRYLREAAAEGGGSKGGEGGGGGKILRGLWERLGTGPGRPEEASAALEQALETLRRVGDGILDKHRLAFQGMLRKMEIKEENDLKTMSEIATHVFSDGVTNWGRIVTLISFGAFVAKHLKSINQENCISTLAEIITDVLVTDKREWLVSHNAWEGFVKFFHVEDIEGSIRNVLVAFASVAGIGAGLAYMIR